MGIGRKVMLLTDASRRDFYSGEPQRRIPISVFYPSPQEGESFYKDLYAPKQELLVKIYGQGQSQRIRHLEGLRSQFINDAAPPVKGPYPVIVFSHGLEADRDFYLFLIEPLVRDGYIVITTGHLYDTDYTLLPGGEVIPMKPGLLGEASFEQRRAQIETRGEDMAFVTDYLKELNSSLFFQGRLDLQRVALCGHSLGGMTVLETMNHPLVKAGVMLDAAVSLSNAADRLARGEGVAKPVLNFRRSNIGYAQRLRARIERLKGSSPQKFQDGVLKEHEEVLKDTRGTAAIYRYVHGQPENFIILEDSVHMTFCDWFSLVPDRSIAGLLPIEQAHGIIVEAVLAFYRQHLLKEGTPYTDLIREGRESQLSLEAVCLD